MRILARPIGLLLTGLVVALFLALAFPQSALAFECTNAGAGSTAPDDGGTLTNTACGEGANAFGIGGTAVGSAAEASTDNSTALGESALASNVDSSAVGRAATASGNASTAVGTSAVTSGNSGTALGFLAFASGVNSTAVGSFAQADQDNSLVLGSIPGVNSASDYVDVGIGISTPMAPLHIRREDGTLEFLRLVSDAMGGAQDRAMMDLTNNGGIRFQFTNALTADAWRFQAGTGGNDNFEITKVGSGKLEMVLSSTGNMTIAGTLTEMSDVNAKQDIAELQGELVLAKLEQVPVSEWRYKASPESKHIGPMAQDFHKAFGLGEDDRHISPRDMAGVNMAAIKVLNEKLEEKKAEITDLKKRLARLEALMQVQR